MSDARTTLIIFAGTDRRSTSEMVPYSRLQAAVAAIIVLPAGQEVILLQPALFEETWQSKPILTHIDGERLISSPSPHVTFSQRGSSSFLDRTSMDAPSKMKFFNPCPT